MPEDMQMPSGGAKPQGGPGGSNSTAWRRNVGPRKTINQADGTNVEKQTGMIGNNYEAE